jgi:hypothetical protein
MGLNASGTLITIYGMSNTYDEATTHDEAIIDFYLSPNQ